MAATPFAQHCYFLNTSDLEATANFYSGIIGLPVVFEQPGFVKFFQVAPQAFLGVCMRGSRDPADVKGAIPTFVCATPAEVDRWQCTMEQHGIEIEKRAGSGISSDGKHLPTLYNLFVRDPAGYLIEFQAFLDPAWPSAGLPPPIAAVAARLDGLVAQSASEVVAQLRAGTVTPAQCVDAFAAQHRASEAAVNAVPILCLERARKAAAAIGAPPSDPPPPGWLYGLPVVIKDLDAVEGVRFTQGSPIYRERVASQSSAVVQQLERRGAIVVGKSNTPEFGAGSHTFNPVFGPTVTPFDVRRTAGGSSGGAAASLASGVGWLASGSDLGGSLRIPASFCGVCGFRVSPGRVARDPSTPSGPFVALHSITGPMARSVQDLALFLDAMVDFRDESGAQLGWDFPAPFNLPEGARCYSDVVQSSVSAPSSTLPPPPPLRVAWSADLGGLLAHALDSEVEALCERAARWFGSSGGGGGGGGTHIGAACSVEAACPDLSQARQVFQVLRGKSFAAKRAAEWASSDHRELLKPEVRWNIGVGHSAAAQPASIAQVQEAHRQLFAGVETFFESYDILVTPAVLLPPFDVRVRYPDRINNVHLPTYVDWMALSWATTVMQCPILALPVGFTSKGLPVGVQLIAKPFAEATLLAAAAAYEAAHPAVSAAVPRVPARLQTDLEAESAAVSGPRTVQEAEMLAGSAGAAFEALLGAPEGGGGFFAVKDGSGSNKRARF